MKVYMHLNFPGNCEQAFRYYEAHLGGRITSLVHKHGESDVPGNEEVKIIHARLELGNATLVGNDVPPAIYKPMRSGYVYLSVDSSWEAERVYKVLGEGGEIFMSLQEKYFASRFSQLRDRFGVSWSIIHETASM